MLRVLRRAPRRPLVPMVVGGLAVLMLPALLDGPRRTVAIASEQDGPSGWAEIGLPKLFEADPHEEENGEGEGEVEGETSDSDEAPGWNPPADAPPSERQANYLWAKSNELRVDNGRRSLKPMDELMARARAWAAHMAEKGELEHSDIRTIEPRWTVVGENVGRSRTIEDVTARLFASPSHRRNILDARFTHTGVGTVRRSDGVLYVAQVFWRG